MRNYSKKETFSDEINETIKNKFLVLLHILCDILLIIFWRGAVYLLQFLEKILPIVDSDNTAIIWIKSIFNYGALIIIVMYIITDLSKIVFRNIKKIREEMPNNFRGYRRSIIKTERQLKPNTNNNKNNLRK